MGGFGDGEVGEHTADVVAGGIGEAGDGHGGLEVQNYAVQRGG